jgi:archaellum biogenesis ATPase FlaH
MKAGRSVIPVNKMKIPVIEEWKPFQTNPADHQQLEKWFPKHKRLALVAGGVSGNLELLDFDNKPGRDIGLAFQEWRSRLEEEAPGLFGRLSIIKTPGEGFHVPYCCPEATIPGNHPLARYKNGKDENGRDKVLTLIETRGAGGYYVAPPSPGYKVMQGDPFELPEVSAREREIMVEAARSFNEYIEPHKVVNGSKPPPRNRANGLSPGDDFNERGDIAELLTKHGWQFHKSNGTYDYWRRPGKDRGHSASVIDGQTFYVFSSNAHPFDVDVGYSKFATYTLLEHDGDYSAAAKVLAQEGYGDKSKSPPADISDHPAWAGEKAKQKRQLFSLKEIGGSFETDIKWLWRDQIPARFPIMFSGREGDGKTTNCVQIAKEILEDNPTDYVVWIASEGFAEDTMSKMLQLGIDDTRILFLKNNDDTFSFNFNITYERKLLDRQLTQHKAEGKTILAVFIDSIRGITPFDDNDSKIKNVMLNLNSIVCDRHRAALIYIDHHKKGEAKSALDKVVGTTAKAAAVRCVYAVTVVSGMVRKIEVAKTNILDHRPTPLKSVFSNAHGLIIYETESADFTMKDEAQRWLIELFSKKDHYLASEVFELGEREGYNSGTLKKAKEDLGIESKQEGFGKPWIWITDRFLESQ